MNNAVSTPRPLKRRLQLRQLSLQHHEILSFVWKIRAGIKANVPPAELGKYCETFWNSMLRNHFIAEEKKIAPLAPADDVLLNTMIEDHDAIKTKIEQVIDEPGIAQLERLADIIYYHVRFEERNLYPHIESIAHYH